jgi:hypothetical protein
LGFFHDIFHTSFEMFAYGFLVGSALLNVVLFVALIPLFLLQTITAVQLASEQNLSLWIVYPIPFLNCGAKNHDRRQTGKFGVGHSFWRQGPALCHRSRQLCPLIENDEFLFFTSGRRRKKHDLCTIRQ